MSDLRQMSMDELNKALDAEIKRDPWVPDWELTHPGRLIREEIERRRVEAEREPPAFRTGFGEHQ